MWQDISDQTGQREYMYQSMKVIVYYRQNGPLLVEEGNEPKKTNSLQKSKKDKKMDSTLELSRRKVA